MSSPTPVLDGVFAINKPAAISSAQVLRDLQKHFNPSRTFAPWLEAERNRVQAESYNQKQKRGRNSRRRETNVKLGHGGTLDPAATGVLIVGVGSGTKSLQGFLGCTKEYEAQVLFGVATDTYDGEGKIVKRAGYESVTKDKVEQALGGFQGQIMQKPPVFSALRVNGKRMYEYAREGGEIPELQPREVTVENVELKEWMEGGKHNLKWPTREAEQEEKDIVDKILHLDEKGQDKTDEITEGNDLKRKRVEEPDEAVNGTVTTGAEDTSKRTKTSPEPTMSGAIPDSISNNTQATPIQTTERQSSPNPSADETPCPAPAARLRMNVSSGFYVRSLCHDLGTAVGSLAFMSTLIRTRQGDFELGKNVLDYEDLDKGEDVWGPKITKMLAEWSKRPAPVEKAPAPRNEKPKTQPQRPVIIRRNTSSDEE